jgi:hypothetical protein
VVPPCRCRYFYGLTKAAGSLGIFRPLGILPAGIDKKEKYGFACGWTAGYRSSCLYRYGTLVDRKERDIRSVAPSSAFSKSGEAWVLFCVFCT